MKKNLTFLLITALIVAGIFLRLYRIQDFVTFLGDQGRDALIVKDIVTLKNFPAIGAPSSIGQIYLGPFYYYLITPFLLFAFFNPIGLAVGVALMSIVGLIYSYKIIKKEINTFTAIVFLALQVFCFTLIDLSRFSWNPNLLPIFAFLSLYFFYEFIKHKKLWASIAFGSFLSFSIQLHYLAALSFIPIIVLLVYEFFIHEHKINLFKKLIPAAISFVVFLSPLILFDIKYNFLNFRNLLKLFTEGNISGESSFISRFMETNRAFFSHLLNIEISSFIAFTLFAAIMGIILFVINKKKTHTFFLLHVLNFFFYIIGFSVLSSARHPHYYGPIYLSFFFIIAYLLHFIHKSHLRNIAAGLIVLLFVGINVPKYYFLYDKSSDQVGYAKEVAGSFKDYVSNEPIQVVALPTTETDGHFRYFLDLKGIKVLPHDSGEQPGELFVMCFQADCKPTDDPHFQIAAFKDKQLSRSWEVRGIKIYKIVHKK